MANKRRFGGIEESEIRDLWTETQSPPPDAGASCQARFCQAVSTLITKRVGQQEKGSFAALLMSEAIQSDVSKCAHTHIPLLDNGSDAITGAIWLTTPTVGDAYRLELDWTDQTELFAAICAADLGHCAAIVVDWRSGTPAVTLFPEGVSKPNDKEHLLVEDRPITESEMKAALDRFYEKSLRTPLVNVEGHALKIWSEAAKGIPAARPEERIQGRLLDGLRSGFPKHSLRAEPVTDDGRADITVFQKVKSTQGHPAIRYDWVLELKALCDKTSTGNAVGRHKVRDAVSSGVDQVAAYRDQLSATNGALCCFDMRINDEGNELCFQGVVAAANSHGIMLWRWFLFRSAGAGRTARVRTRAT